MSMTRCPLSDNKKHEFRARGGPLNGGYYCVFCLDEFNHVERREFRDELLRVEAVTP